MADAVRVVARIRPEEQQSSSSFIIRSTSAQSLELKTGEVFSFARVLDQTATQEDTFEAVGGSSLISEVLMGFNVSIIAYGQTNSGKTFTMMGNQNESSSLGIIPRLAKELFLKLDALPDHPMVSIKVSFVELYREGLRDLLNSHSGKRNGGELRIREDDSKRMLVEGLSEEAVSSWEDLMLKMQRGNHARTVAFTKMNEDSSRSHSIFTLKISQTAGQECVESKIQLVDLAGSEALKRTGAMGDRLEEAKAINLSLSCLGNVVSALAEHAKFVPYRDSKLTRMLQDSLGGTAKTCLICTVSPLSVNEGETVNTLKFGTRAQRVENFVKRHIRRSEEELERLLSVAEEKIRSLLAGGGGAVHHDSTAAELELMKAKEEIHMLKTAKVDQVWVYLLEAQERLRTCEKDKSVLESEVNELKLEIKSKQEALDELKWEFATVKKALSEKLGIAETKLSTTRAELKRFKPSSVMTEEGSSLNSTTIISQSEIPQEEASFLSIEEDD